VTLVVCNASKSKEDEGDKSSGPDLLKVKDAVEMKKEPEKPS